MIIGELLYNLNLVLESLNKERYYIHDYIYTCEDMLNIPENYTNIKINMKNKQFIYTEEQAQKFYFTSDTHFGHENIIKYCKRPFNSVDEHDEALIKNWNEVVPEDGIVFHLGDVAFGNPNRINEIFNQLNGTIYLVIGNHDWRRIVSEHAWRFGNITQQINMKIGKRHIILNHYPMLAFSGAWKGEDATYQLFGHVHTSPYTDEGLDQQRMKYLFTSQYDVGVDNNNFHPRSWNDIDTIIHNQMMSLGMCRNVK